MKPKNQKLYIKQLDEQLQKLKAVDFNIPEKGWIHTIRKVICMSTSQLAAKLGISHQALSYLEKREADETITIKKLKEAGAAMGLKLIYGFVPETSLEVMIEERAHKLAIKIVMLTSKQMELEDQKIRDAKLKEAVAERTQEIIRTMPKSLWD